MYVRWWSYHYRKRGEDSVANTITERRVHSGCEQREAESRY